MVLRTRHDHVEEAALLVGTSLLYGLGGREQPLAAPRHEHDGPFHALRLVDGRQRHAVRVGIVLLRVQVRQQRHVLQEALESVLRSRDLRSQFLHVLEAVLGVLLLPLLAQMVLVEEVREVRNKLADLVLLQMLLRLLEAGAEPRPDRLGLLREQLAERLAVLLALAVELAPELLPVLLRARLSDAGQKRRESDERELVRRIHENAQITEDVLRVDLLEDADAGRDAERHLHARERHLHVDGLEMAAVEDRDVAVAVAELMGLVDEPHDLLSLRLAVVHLVQPGLLAAARAERT